LKKWRTNARFWLCSRLASGCKCLEVKDLEMAPQVGLEPTTLRLTGGEVGITCAPPRIANKRVRWQFFEVARKVVVLSCGINATRKGSVSRAILLP
jgi:hypothetical protein